eukprot:3084014-Amphidinium_carterae.1
MLATAEVRGADLRGVLSTHQLLALMLQSHGRVHVSTKNKVALFTSRPCSRQNLLHCCSKCPAHRNTVLVTEASSREVSWQIGSKCSHIGLELLEGWMSRVRTRASSSTGRRVASEAFSSDDAQRSKRQRLDCDSQTPGSIACLSCLLPLLTLTSESKLCRILERFVESGLWWSLAGCVWASLLLVLFAASCQQDPRAWLGRYELSTLMLQLGVGFSDFVAFASYSAQWPGLVGAKGLAPAEQVMADLRRRLHRQTQLTGELSIWTRLSHFSSSPTIFWNLGSMSYEVTRECVPHLHTHSRQCVCTRFAADSGQRYMICKTTMLLHHAA